MPINKTLLALALGLALAACTNGEKAQAAVQNAAPATAQPAVSDASPVTAAAGTPATDDAAAMAASAANPAATIATDAAAPDSNSAAMATNASGATADKAVDAAIQSQDTNVAGFTADLIEAKRSDGVLSIKVRLKNTDTKPARVKIYESRNIDAFYVQAESKKYFVLRDTENEPLTVAWDGTGALEPQVAPGASFTWWAKFPAPSENVKKFSFYWPLGAPFDDVPITDK